MNPNTTQTVEEILDAHAEVYARATMNRITGKITKAECDKLWHVSDLKTKAAINNLTIPRTEHERLMKRQKLYEFSLGALSIIGHYKEWLAMGLNQMQIAAKLDELEPEIRATLTPNGGNKS